MSDGIRDGLSSAAESPHMLASDPSQNPAYYSSIVKTLKEARRMFAQSTSTTVASNPDYNDLCELEAWAMQLQIEDTTKPEAGLYDCSLGYGFEEFLAKDALRMLGAVEVYTYALTVRQCSDQIITLQHASQYNGIISFTQFTDPPVSNFSKDTIKHISNG